ncbi:hypothetical protein NQZ68_039698 [Dissostichus eleginoides]|nr:hypothetical protein NQZ68_039698 [Dissostichus eleginoides]
MAALYQRFSGRINTNKTFPNPPEANHLLGQGVDGERAAESTRARAQNRQHREDEDDKQSDGAVGGAEIVTRSGLHTVVALHGAKTSSQKKQTHSKMKHLCLSATTISTIGISSRERQTIEEKLEDGEAVTKMLFSSP